MPSEWGKTPSQGAFTTDLAWVPTCDEEGGDQRATACGRVWLYAPGMATKWAYLTVTKLPRGWLVEGEAVLSNEDDPEHVLTDLGDAGWELVTAFLEPQRYIFKRPKPDVRLL